MNKQSSRLDQLFQYLETNPNDSFARFCIAQEYKKAGDTAQARVYFQQLKDQDPDYIGTYYHLGKLHEEQGDDEQAAKVYKEGMDIARKNQGQHALHELSQAYQVLTGGDDQFDDDV